MPVSELSDKVNMLTVYEDVPMFADYSWCVYAFLALM